MKKIRFITLLIFISTTCIPVYSQDIITLINGNEIEAKVIEISPSEIKYKKFDNLGGPTIVVQKNEVFLIKYENGTREKINIEASQKKNTIQEKSAEFSPVNLKSNSSSRGYYGHIDIGYGIGIGDFDGAFKIDAINGYKFNNYFTMAFGAGIRSYGDIDGVIAAFYVTPKFNFSKRSLSPFISLGAGASTDFDWETGGMVYMGTFGLDYVINNGPVISFGIYLENQALEIELPFYDGVVSGWSWQNKNAVTLGFSVGVTF